MIIGVSTRDEGEFSARIGFSPPREAVIYDAELPLEVKDALRAVRKNLDLDKSHIHVAAQTHHRHGNDYGFDFREGAPQIIELNPTTAASSFVSKNLVARVSLGMASTKDIKEIGKDETIYKNPNLLKRLHLNVFGSRQFLPENFKEMQKRREAFAYLSEKIHFSMRWLDGKFDGVWNDFYEFE
ncbi:hypothetical protein GOV13_01020 [Candidatus Pacearchaeota archaeon]|nr:hypothetical protein [Candidatus Pacearchaeota archaeon]